MRAWVVMGNDYPEAAFRTLEPALQYVALMKRRNADYMEKANKVGPSIHWREVEIELDPRVWPEDPAHPLCAACNRRVKSPCNDMAGYMAEGPWDFACTGHLFQEREEPSSIRPSDGGSYLGD